MYQMDLFVDVPVRATKQQRIIWGFQVHAFVLGYAFVIGGTFLWMSIQAQSWFQWIIGFALGWQASKSLPSFGKDFLLFSLLRFPKLKKKWRGTLRPKLIQFRRYYAVQ